MWSRFTRAASINLYRYKRYDDVRLVFAPEEQIAFYGGDPDNFEYPRFDLDICIFRAYENGQPAKIEHFLKWNPKGPSDGELTFVSGHPGRTDRQLTVERIGGDAGSGSALSAQHVLPARRSFLQPAGRAVSKMRGARSTIIRGVENNRKRYAGYLAALLDPEISGAIEAARSRNCATR